MSKLMLTLEETEAINAANPKQTKLLLKILNKLPDQRERDEFRTFSINLNEEHGFIQFSYSISNDNGLLSDRFSIIISSHGKIESAESNYGTGTNYVEDYDTVKRMKKAIFRFVENTACWG